MAASILVVVGHCTSTTARVLVCARKKHAVARIAYRTNGGAIASVTTTLTDAPPYRMGVFELSGLPPGARVEYAVTGAETIADLPVAPTLPAGGALEFRLLPAGRPPRIALVSCNGWFQIADEVRRFALWKSLREEIAAGRVDLVVYAGDQIYADPIWMDHDSQPRNAGLAPSSIRRVEQLTVRYREWYFRTWTHPVTQSVLASCPSVMTWDDHDIYDGWGSNDDDVAPPQQAFFVAARRAFLDFQMSHGPPSIGDATSSAWGFVHEGLGVLALDTRTNRMWARHSVLGAAQHDAIEAWIDVHAASMKHLVVVSSIPPMHASVSAALTLMAFVPFTPEPLDDLRDAWVARNNRMELQRLMLRLVGTMQSFPALRISIVSGDVHVGTLGRIESTLPAHARADGARPRIHQIVSSGIGHPPPGGIAYLLMSLVTGGEMELGGEEFQGRLLPFGERGDCALAKRNFAVISFAGSDNEWSSHGNLIVEFHAEGEPAPIVQRLLGI